MSETCFTNCVDNFNTRSLDLNEEQCVERCMGKYINFNHRILSIYAESQEKIMKKRIEDLNNNEQLTESNNNNNLSNQTATEGTQIETLNDNKE